MSTAARTNRTAPEEPGAVEKALRVLDVLGQSTGLGLTEVSRRSGVPKTTCLRLLRSLMSHGYVMRDGKRYRLTWRLLEVGRGARFCEPGGLRDIAQPHLSELQQQTGLSVNLAVLQDADTLYLTRIHRAFTFALPGGTGSRVPATCTAIGKAILAFEPAERRRELLAGGIRSLTPYSISSSRVLEDQFAEIRRIGLATDREESSIGVACTAAPVLHRGRAIAAISVSGQVERQQPRSLDGLLRKAVAATASHYARSKWS